MQKYPARIAGYLSAISLNAMKYWTKVPVGLMIPIAMMFVLLGEGSQRLEDKKTLEALYTKNDPNKPDEEILAEMMEHLETTRKKRKNGRTKSTTN